MMRRIRFYITRRAVVPRVQRVEETCRPNPTHPIGCGQWRKALPSSQLWHKLGCPRLKYVRHFILDNYFEYVDTFQFRKHFVHLTRGATSFRPPGPSDGECIRGRIFDIFMIHSCGATHSSPDLASNRPEG